MAEAFSPPAVSPSPPELVMAGLDHRAVLLDPQGGRRAYARKQPSTVASFSTQPDSGHRGCACRRQLRHPRDLLMPPLNARELGLPTGALLRRCRGPPMCLRHGQRSSAVNPGRVDMA